LTWDFLGVNILSWEPSRAQKVNEGGHGGQTRPGGAGPSHTTHVRLGLKPPVPSIFISWRPAWPKNTYIKTPPLAFPRGGRGETRIKAIPVKIGGETLLELPRTLLQPLWHQHHRRRHEEGVVHLWTMGLWK
jgi:hypothetical protein